MDGRALGLRVMAGLIAALSLAGCRSRPDIPAERLSDEAVTSSNPFAPVSMIVHPLTRLDFDTPESPGRIICHLELRDSWDDPCKGIGRVKVDLLRPTLVTNVGEQTLTWEVDLSDLPTNARLYDQATRTYRLALDDAPNWLVTPSASGQTTPGRLAVTLTGPDIEGKMQRLRAEYVLEH